MRENLTLERFRWENVGITSTTACAVIGATLALAMSAGPAWVVALVVGMLVIGLAKGA